MAFCHWLSAKLGAKSKVKVTLPTECQWQLAATGGDPGRIYPWRDPLDPHWDPVREPWRANTSESGLGRTLPVGFYPLGASPAGVLDMTGNLWDWCLDPYREEGENWRPWYKKLWVRQKNSSRR
ncbi:MAG TPA: SUMF1/EgtB/PvdO family nonheme iron enzyme [Terriglobales bacterium]|nr:SUMF1/EgtB/PvdO family nonheme iron enzyme [Terriglobales bacterium]